ncbi:MAG: hypothetical protein J6V44_13100 [Methanobrevibacter sp.]|nr:hypothetical protein [Methanobrevibacter sp.]MBO7696792.1 hypothetical protein [Methanobrevibacter sp.]
MFDMDVYSDCICSLYKKYKEGDIKSIFDWDIQLDYKIVCQASMTEMKEDAAKMAKELLGILEEEILYRMGRYRIQASCAANFVYHGLINGSF